MQLCTTYLDLGNQIAIFKKQDSMFWNTMFFATYLITLVTFQNTVIYSVQIQKSKSMLVKKMHSNMEARAFSRSSRQKIQLKEKQAMINAIGLCELNTILCSAVADKQQFWINIYIPPLMQLHHQAKPGNLLSNILHRHNF